MPTTYDIILPRGMVLIRHSGHITVAESETAFRAFQQDPHQRPGQPHLVDCQQVVSYERDFAKFMALQAEIVGQFGVGGPEMLLVLLGPPGVPHELATLIRNTWDRTPSVVPRVVSTEAEAMDVLGLTERRILDILALV